jgi:leader peptidase (prepilin peptidase)/N-methyltransferase
MYQIEILSLLCFILGASLGRFLSVCVYRLPMGKYEPVHDRVVLLEDSVSISSPPRSFCPHCRRTLLWYHNIPVVSWFLLRGRCAYCQTQIPFRYLLLELLTGVLCMMCYLRFGFTVTGLAAFIFCAVLVVITFIDIDYMIIQDIISYPGIIIGLAIALANECIAAPGAPLLQEPFVQNIPESVFGIVIGAGPVWLVRWVYLTFFNKEGLGLGDVKLLGMIGATFGWECALASLLVGSCLGSVVGILLLLFRRLADDRYLPFGPYLVFGCLAYLLRIDELFFILRGYDITYPHWWIVTYPTM